MKKKGKADCIETRIYKDPALGSEEAAELVTKWCSGVAITVCMMFCEQRWECDQRLVKRNGELGLKRCQAPCSLLETFGFGAKSAEGTDERRLIGLPKEAGMSPKGVGTQGQIWARHALAAAGGFPIPDCLMYSAPTYIISM